ncbi:catechol 2,3-dioxygenase-like lactoylglutathione lyase family enzyme [Bradyrhizobium sp. cir1]|nr:catechol 2,3-dioxygenase-like lactoylglutathione lyase family enzyme [Bradyrhizobium sp. cir1]
MEPEGQIPGERLTGDFDAADELLFAAQSGALGGLGPIRVQRSGQIGPLVELVRARRRYPEAYASVVLEAPFVATIDAALDGDAVAGTERNAQAGVFPLQRLGADGARWDLWQLWASRADQAALTAGFPAQIAAEIVGALGELQDNVFRHSEAAHTGLVAFAARPGAFEVVVSDSGTGVLASLRSHADYAGIEDAGMALKVAVADGESRFGRDSGCGFGMGQMFRALANHDGDLRFRSDDHALEVRGHSPSLQGRVQLRQKTPLPGLTVSVLCRPTSVPGRTL